MFNYRSSYSQLLYQKRVLRNFAKFTEKQLCRCFFSIENKVYSLLLYLKRHSAIYIFRRILQKFLEHIFYRTAKVFRTYLLQNTSGWLPLYLLFTDNKDIGLVSSMQIGGIRTFYPLGIFLGLGVLGHFGSKKSGQKNCQNS